MIISKAERKTTALVHHYKKQGGSAMGVTVNLSKSVEDELYRNLDDEEYILPYTALYTFHTHHEIVRAALFNPKFLRYFWERAKTEHNIPISDDLRKILDTMDQIGLEHVDLKT